MEHRPAGNGGNQEVTDESFARIKVDLKEHQSAILSAATLADVLWMPLGRPKR